MGSNLETFEALRAHFGARGSGDSFQARCPCHEDTRESLTCTIANDKLLIHCHAGCSFESIKSALPEFFKKKEQARVIVKTYDYVDRNGVKQFEVVRYSPKDFRQRRVVNGEYVWSLKDVAPILYNLPAVLGAECVYLCEGEKDADNLNALGLVATTNPSGATKWRKEYTEQLRNVRELIICEDNDDAGRARTKRIIEHVKGVVDNFMVLRFEDLPVKSDVSDFLAKFPTKEEKLDQLSRRTVDALFSDKSGSVEEEIEEEDCDDEPKRKVKKPSYCVGKGSAAPEDYVEFVKRTPHVAKNGPMRRELLSDKLVIKGPYGIYEPVDNYLLYFRGCANHYPRYFSGRKFEEMLEEHRMNLAPEVCLDIPKWDRVDRLADIASVIKFRNVTQQQFYDLIRGWGATLWQRLNDPFTQPILPIFVGAQGLGKDTLINALCGGLGFYYKKLDVRKNRPEEAMAQLHTALVFGIEEYDRISKTDPSTLKAIVTSPWTDRRLSYERSDKKRMVRASFIASSNTLDILTDSTGNRRFWIFDMIDGGFELRDAGAGLMVGTSKVIRDYPGHYKRKGQVADRLQILAQFKELGESGYQVPIDSENAMVAYIDGLTPEDSDVSLCEEWEAEIRGAAMSGSLTEEFIKDGIRYYSVFHTNPMVDKIAKGIGKSRRAVRRILGNRGYRMRTNTSIFYAGSLTKVEIPEYVRRDSGFGEQEVIEF